MKLVELDGYCVPPKGIVTVSVNGQGIRAGKAGWIYPPGTFRENRHTIGKELGVSSVGAVTAREQARKDAIIEGVAAYFEGKNTLTLDTLRDKDPQVIAACVIWALGIIDEAQSPREALNFAKWLKKEVTHKEEVLGKLKGEENAMAGLAMNVIDAILDRTDKEIARATGDVVEGEIVDVGDPE